MVWPSYWGRLNNGKLTPMLPEEVAKTDKFPPQASEDAGRDPYNTKPLTEAQIQTVLEALSADKAKGEAVYIAAGKKYRLQDGKLQSAVDDAAKAYAWPLAHDVRPATQSAGARGCAECHSSTAPIYYGTVLARGPVAPANGARKAMWELRGDDQLALSTFASTFLFRPALKYITFGCAVVVLGILLNYGLAGLGALAGRGRAKAAALRRAEKSSQ
jgi:hypothetical protein